MFQEYVRKRIHHKLKSKSLSGGILSGGNEALSVDWIWKPYPQYILNLLIEQEEDRNNYNDMKSDYFNDSDVSKATKKQLHELF